MREGVLLEGAAGWGEFSPFLEYDAPTSAPWLACAWEAAHDGWPDPVRSVVPVNVTVPACDPEQARRIVLASQGCRTAKVKVAEAGQSPGEDEARLEAVRDALGADGLVRIDANGGWTVDEAVVRIPVLEKAAGGLEYVEQPCASVEDLALVRRRVDVRIAADESIRRAEDPYRVRDLEAADVAVLKVQPLGGVRACLRIAEDIGLPGRRLQRRRVEHRDRGRRGPGGRAALARARLGAGDRAAALRGRRRRVVAAGRREPAGAQARGLARPARRGRRPRRPGGALATATRRGVRAGTAGSSPVTSPSAELATWLLDELVERGLTDAVLCPGSRNAPLSFALAADPRVRLHTRIDERTAGFLALGLARASRRPVAVVTTSGTATANLHPAVLEAAARGSHPRARHRRPPRAAAPDRRQPDHRPGPPLRRRRLLRRPRPPRPRRPRRRLAPRRPDPPERPARRPARPRPR